MSLISQTVDTYNRSAAELAKKFDAIGPRATDINFVFSFCTKQNPKVLEIGCANGRDALEICKHTTNYTGIDISEKLIALAKKNLPEKTFITSDITTAALSSQIDIIFAFASLIHLQKESIQVLMKKLAEALNPNGLVFISNKHSPSYEQITKEDEFGTRTYWHYSESDMKDIASDFMILDMKIQTIKGQRWVDVLYQKK